MSETVSAKRILLVHPQDPLSSIGGGDYDLVVDLGYAPASTYADWSRISGCPVVSLSNFRDPKNDLQRLPELMQFGIGQLLDDDGLDWWDLISICFYEQMLEVFALERLLSTCRPSTGFSISRRGFHARAVEALLGRNVKVLRAAGSLNNSFGRKISAILRLRPRQIVEIVGDKYDGNYRLRRHFAGSSLQSAEPVVLLPSAYGNSTRTALAYAGSVPDTKFLLVATRQSGWAENPLRNVTCERLAAFAPGKCNPREIERLLSSWQNLLSALAQHLELSALVRAGCFESVPQRLEEGLCIRDAWIEVFASNPIAAVLCADEMNWYTRIPLLLARARGLPAIACHHGALDFRYAFRETSADRVLVKGRMERDYMVSLGVPEYQLEIAAPPRKQQFRRGPSARDAIICFSEPYEAFGGRADGFYREVLPPLADLARQHGKKLIIKLHPYESHRERRRIAEAALSSVHHEPLLVVDGPLQNDLLDRAWFGVTVSSTTTVDCAVCDIPVFLCRWLDASYAAYSDQFINLGAAKQLSSADEIHQIPEMLTTFVPPNLQDFSDPVEPERLRELFSGKNRPAETENVVRIGA